MAQPSGSEMLPMRLPTTLELLRSPWATISSASAETLGGFYILYSVVSKKTFFRFQIVFLADSFTNSSVEFVLQKIPVYT